MDVLVTGGSGYVGSYTVAALIQAGHSPRLLVRNRKRLADNLRPLGIDADALDVVMGDMTDRAAVVDATSGVDAVIHGAAVVAALDRSDAERTIETNVNGTKTVIEAALAGGCSRIIHVSSVAALFAKTEPLIHADLPPATSAASPYTRSKALCEQFVRARQTEGAPVTIVYPGGVCGPPAGDAFGDVAEGIISMLKTGAIVVRDGGIGILDVRDLADVLVAGLTTASGPQRFMTGGQLTDIAEIAAILRRVTGRRIPVLPTPGAVFRALGRVADGVRRVVPFDTVFTAEAMDLLTLAQPTDDSRVHEELGITYRDPADSIAATISGLYAAGRLSDRNVGALAG